jgi:hypothetical protein
MRGFGNFQNRIYAPLNSYAFLFPGIYPAAPIPNQPPAAPAPNKPLNPEAEFVKVPDVIAGIGPSAVPALIETLKNENMRRNAAGALGAIIQNCKTIETVNEFETRLQDGMNKLRKHWRKGVTTEFGLQISKLMIAAAQKKNKLAPKRDIILEGVPKPPKKGKIYQQMRGTVRNG